MRAARAAQAGPGRARLGAAGFALAPTFQPCGRRESRRVGPSLRCGGGLGLSDEGFYIYFTSRNRRRNLRRVPLSSASSLSTSTGIRSTKPIPASMSK